LESIDVGPFSDHDMEAIDEFSCIDECRQTRLDGGDSGRDS